MSALVGLVSLGAAASCEGRSGCGNLHCGSGVLVWWSPGDVPDAASHQLCVNGACESVEPAAVGSAGQYLSVAPASGIADDDVTVDLELHDDQGAKVAVFSGAGHKTGRCCSGVAFRVTSAGELVVDSF